MKNRKIYFVISAVVILAGIISICIQGFNLGIDFRGGTLLNVDLHKEVDNAEVISVIEQCGGKDVNLQTSEGSNYVIRFYVDETQDISEIRESITKELETKYGKKVSGTALDPSFDTVSATASQELVLAAFWTVLLATACMLVYIWFRFELSFGIAAVIGLLHDILITLTVVSIFQIQINSTFIAAILTIVGYTINNTIVVFDRIRENNKKYDVKTYDKTFVVQTSVKESITRAVFSSLTTLFTIGALCILGVTSVREFAIPIVVGIVSSIYSCIFINPQVWEMLPAMKFGKGKGNKKTA